KYGIPLMVSIISDSIFGGLSESEAASFFAALPDAIETDGKDLTRVGWKFLAAELRALPTVPAGVQEKIDPVIKGMDLLAEGKEWPASASASASAAAWAIYADSAVTDAVTAAWSAAWAANADSAANAALAAISFRKAADSATFAARARQATALAAAHAIIIARRRQRDTLLQLIKEAPLAQPGDDS
ncbi:MAG: hypothetical protein GY883_23465, partial [Shimia sp.]|nr:hypothetical protein [Shimia sp.]